MEWLVFTGWVISQAKDYPNYYGEEAAMSRNYWATAHFLAFQWLALNCHGTGGSHFAYANILQ